MKQEQKTLQGQGLPLECPEIAAWQQGWATQLEQAIDDFSDKLCSPPTKKEKPMAERRLVRIAVIDPDRKLKAKDALLYASPDAFLTDLEANELLLEMDPSITELLKAHNAFRGTMEDIEESRKVEKTIYLRSDLEVSDLSISVTCQCEC